MTYFEVVILALAQGLTEFLPVSSSGQLVALRHFVDISDRHGAVFDAWLHLGSLGAVLVYYRRIWHQMVRSLWIRDEAGRGKRKLLFKIILATVPAGAVGFFFHDYFESAFRSATAVAFGLLVTAACLLLADIMPKKSNQKIPAKNALYIGLAQVTALLPGISRSGITIAAGRSLGLSRKKATNFSFLMSAPIIAGAGLMGMNSLMAYGEIGLTKLSVGILVSFVTALATIHVFIKFIEKISFFPFVIYIIILAMALVLYA